MFSGAGVQPGQDSPVPRNQTTNTRRSQSLAAQTWGAVLKPHGHSPARSRFSQYWATFTSCSHQHLIGISPLYLSTNLLLMSVTTVDPGVWAQYFAGTIISTSASGIWSPAYADSCGRTLPCGCSRPITSLRAELNWIVSASMVDITPQQGVF